MGCAALEEQACNFCICSEQQQSFRHTIEAANGMRALREVEADSAQHGHCIISGELRHHALRLVEDKISVGGMAHSGVENRLNTANVPARLFAAGARSCGQTFFPVSKLTDTSPPSLFWAEGYFRLLLAHEWLSALLVGGEDEPSVLFLVAILSELGFFRIERY